MTTVYKLTTPETLRCLQRVLREKDAEIERLRSQRDILLAGAREAQEAISNIKRKVQGDYTAYAALGMAIGQAEKE